MKKVTFLAAIGLLACAADRPADTAASDRDALQGALAGYRQSGPPVTCVDERDLRGNRSAGNGAIIFEGMSSATLWVNQPAGGCPSLEGSRMLVARTPSARLCRGDIVSVVDPVAHITYGGCGLGDFTPYRRVARR
jgi:hypothetical protein